MPTSYTIQEWIDTSITANISSHHLGTECETCSTNTHISGTFWQPLPFLHFEVPPEMTSSVLPSHILSIYNTGTVENHYVLRGIIYHGQLHFTARLISTNHTSWTYDSQVNKGIPIKENSPSDNDIGQLTLL